MMLDLSHAFDFSPSSPVYSLALNLVIISLVLSSFALGISQAIRSKKLWSWGTEEFAQALINAILLGAIMGSASFAGLLMSSANSMVDNSVFTDCTYPSQSQNSPIAYSLCSIESAQEMAWEILSAVESQAFSLGVISSISLDFNVASASPFASLLQSSENYSDWASSISTLISTLEFNRQFLFLIAQLGFTLFLPLGLLLRMFFATRKLGGAIMAGAIGFFVLYPLLYSGLVLESQQLRLCFDDAFLDLEKLSQTLHFVPTLDWGKDPDMAGLINSVEGSSLLQKVSQPYKSTSVFMGTLATHAFLYPLISLGITLVCILELSALLGREFRIDLFEKI